MLDNRIGYAGYIWDPWLKVYHVRHRVYMPGTQDGRDVGPSWLQPDPIGIAGGLNLFEYCNGDPMSFVDPMGLWGWDNGWIEYGVGGLLGFHGAGVAVNSVGHGLNVAGQAGVTLATQAAANVVDTVGMTASLATGLDYRPWGEAGMEADAAGGGKTWGQVGTETGSIAGSTAISLATLGAYDLGNAIGEFLIDGDADRAGTRAAQVGFSDLLGAAGAKIAQSGRSRPGVGSTEGRPVTPSGGSGGGTAPRPAAGGAACEPSPAAVSPAKAGKTGGVHKNSAAYDGPVRVYEILDSAGNTHRFGETARGNRRSGTPIRVQEQLHKLPAGYSFRIIELARGKAAAWAKEKGLIMEYERLHGTRPPKNKTYR